MIGQSHLGGLLDLPRAETDDERRAIWRQAMATLARIALEQQPVPLEGLDPALLLEAVRAAFKHDLLRDLDWLSPPGAAAAVYELASAIPVGPERRQLGRQVLTRLYEGDAETFVVLATSLAAESKRTLTGAPIRARLALALALPVGSGVHADALALALISRPDLRREWLSDPAMGSLPSRHLAARLLERAARESARRAAQGDNGSLRAFQEPSVKLAWQQLLNDRESLVWRHVAIARGLLSGAISDFAEEIDSHLSHELTPTEWRRAAVSLSASIALNPQTGLSRCRAVLADDTLRSDTGLIETMIFGLARAAEVEPEAAEDLLEQIVRMGGIEAAEALVELRRERVGAEFGARASRLAREKLKKWLSTQRFDDDGRVALCEALIEELSPEDQRTPSLRDGLELALRLFAQRDARQAYEEAQRVWEAAQRKIGELEALLDDSDTARQHAFRVLRELQIALLETAALSDLLNIGASGKAGGVPTSLNDLFERLTRWLLQVEDKPIEASGAVPHLMLRLRRLRSMLHLVDADGSYGEDATGQRRARRLRTVRLLLNRSQRDASSPLRRIVCAGLARALDASMRDDVCELSDALVAVVDHVPSAHDIATLAEASMMPPFQRCLAAYTQLLRASERAEPSGRHARATIDALRELGQSLPWANTLRVSAVRGHLLALARKLEDIAAARSLSELAQGSGRDHLVALDAIVAGLCRLTRGARRRLDTPVTGTTRDSTPIGMLSVAIEKGPKEGREQFQAAMEATAALLDHELPRAIAKTVLVVLRRLEQLPATDVDGHVNSFAPSTPKEAPLPPWLNGRRSLGGFYVLHPLGVGGVGSVFVVTRLEERHREDAVRFALKVPDYSAEAARTLSEEEFSNLFRQEAGALLALPRHENLAAFVTFDAGARPKPILVMELVEGPTLERVIERGDLDIKRALSLLDGIGAGLERMHRVGIGHLDVKPSNVIMRNSQSSQGDKVTPVLVDFGLAGRHLRPGCATGPYGAPEIWGLTPPDHQPAPMSADVYAYACMAYETLTGDTLFDGQTEMAVINAHVSHDGYPEKLQALRRVRGLSDFCDLLANCLRQHPHERISVPEMREGFRELGPLLARFLGRYERREITGPAMATHYRQVPQDTTGMPTGVPYIVGNELAERFSYYGMKTILVVFMTHHVKNAAGAVAPMSGEEAKVAFHLFAAGAYFFPLLGALIADIFWGKYRTVMVLSTVYCLGHFALALDETRVGLTLGLCLIALGAGGIKPCVSAHVGDQFGEKNQALLSRVFGWFYFSINLGAFVSTLLTPFLLERFGSRIAFGVPGVLMVLATLVFWLGRNHFAHIPPAGNGFARELLSKHGLEVVGRLFGLVLFIAMFWSLYDQNGSAWVLQAEHMDLEFLGITWLPSQIQAINPILILGLIPLMTYQVYPAISRVFPLTPLRKISIGFFLMVGAFVVSAFIEMRLQAGVRMNIGWQILAYVILTLSEVMVYGTGLEFFYTQAPNRMKSFIMGLFLLAVSLGNMFTSLVNHFIMRDDGTSRLTGTEYYLFFAGLMLLTSLGFIVYASRYRAHSFLQGDDEPTAASAAAA